MLKKVATSTSKIKRRFVGGSRVRSIYGPGGLADRLRAVRTAKKHNTMDRTHGIGRPPQNDDGTRSYQLVSRVSRFDDDEVVDVFHISGPPTRCPSCDADDPGFIDYIDPDLPVRCDFCSHETTLSEWADDCHEDEDEEAGDDHQAADTAGAEVVTYRGVRRTLPSWDLEPIATTTITRDGAELPWREDLRVVTLCRDWGPRSHEMSRKRLALDLACDVLNNDDRALSVYEVLSEALIHNLVGDEWEITADQLRSGIEAIERAQKPTHTAQ